MIWILDYTEDYMERYPKTEVFEDTGNSDAVYQVIGFIADKSAVKDFKVLRINKYDKGELKPYELTLVTGKISLRQQPTKKEATNYDPT